MRVRVRVRVYRLEPHISRSQGGACVHNRSGAQGKWQRESYFSHRSQSCSAATYTCLLGRAFAAQIKQRIRLAEATATF